MANAGRQTLQTVKLHLIQGGPPAKVPLLVAAVGSSVVRELKPTMVILEDQCMHQVLEGGYGVASSEGVTAGVRSSEGVNAGVVGENSSTGFRRP